MKKKVILIALSLLALATTVVKGGISYKRTDHFATKLTEDQKIDLLISYIRNLKNAVFIRNGSEHSAEEAADHLQNKRKSAGKKIKTAIDFIVHIGSRSSMSGKPYQIKFNDGKVLPSAQLLTEELKRIEKQNQQ